MKNEIERAARIDSGAVVVKRTASVRCVTSMTVTNDLIPASHGSATETEDPGAHRTWNSRDRILALIVSLALVIPCFWHSHLEAGDLGSHAYNAWLVQLIHEGKAPGLTIVRQWDNVFFDFLLSGLGHAFSLLAAARIASAIAALLFFWGAFSFVSAAAGRISWLLIFFLAAISYGWTFNAGLSNYYISVGLAFFALAIVYRGWNRAWLALIVLVPLMYLAHPIGICWAAAAGAYVFVAKRMPPKGQAALFAAGLCGIVAARFFLRMNAITKPPSHSVVFYNGLDQIFFTNRYAILVALLWCLILAAYAVEFGRGQREFRAALIPVQLYLLVEAGVQLLPASILFKRSVAQFSEVSDRFTLISAVLLCVLLACAKPPRWLLSCVAGVALVFFIFLYQDTAVIDRMEKEAEILVHQFPQGQRVVATINPPLKYRFQVRHIVDLACLGYCYAYGNYEPSTHQFRVRAADGNAFVVSRVQDSLNIDAGTYVVAPNAAPMFQLYQCGTQWTKMCIRSLKAGESLRANAKSE